MNDSYFEKMKRSGSAETQKSARKEFSPSKVELSDAM